MEKHNHNFENWHHLSPEDNDREDEKNDRSLTNDESADTDPNQVSDKPSFTDDRDPEESGQFDGNIDI